MRSQYFELSSWYGNTIAAPSSDFDVTFFFAGWESRATEITSMRFISDLGVVVNWKEADSPQCPWAPSIRDKLTAFSSDACREILSLSLDMVTELERGVAELVGVLVTRFRYHSRPLRILIDVSNCPEYFCMALLAFSLRSGIAAQWSFFYAEAYYPTGSGPMTFTHGRWNALPVPFLRAPFDPEAETCLLLGLGFEGEQALQLFNRYQPDRVHVVLPDPGFTADYTDRAKHENRALLGIIETLPTPANDVLRVRAGDALEAYTAIFDVLNSEDAAGNCNVILIPTGPKPHAIAMALVGFDRPRTNVLYRNPEVFHVNDSVGNGNSWLFAVADRTVLVPRNTSASVDVVNR